VPTRRTRGASGLSAGQIRLSLKPGQKGTRRLLAKYGERLVCVRYRYDPARKKRIKTVEIVVDERDWLPPRPRPAAGLIVGVRVAFEEVDLRRRVKQAGGTWNPQRRLWQLRYGEAVALGLADRVVTEQASIRRCPASSGKHLHADAAEASR
jgi:hypothetical protein